MERTISSIEKPFTLKLGFGKLFEQLDQMIISAPESTQARITADFLSTIQHRAELTEGVSCENFEKYRGEIDLLMEILFPEPLTNNEIKVANPPMATSLLRRSKRFESIFGDVNELEVREFLDKGDDKIYILMCTFIIGAYYGIPLNAHTPPIYPLTQENGITKYYKSLYNADFIEITPHGTPPDLTDELLNELKDDYSNIDLWKKVFPPNSWELKGFGLRSFFNVSSEEALTRLKNLLIDQRSAESNPEFQEEISGFVRTIFDIPDLKCTFTWYNEDISSFAKPTPDKTSIALKDLEQCDRYTLMCSQCADSIFNNKKSLVIRNTAGIPESMKEYALYKNILEQGIKSYIMTPLYDGDRLLGVVEFGSTTPDTLSSSSLEKINELITISRNAIKSFVDEFNTQLTAVIQTEYTAIHPAVAWKFREQAEEILQAKLHGDMYDIGQIVFSELTALYGQTDVARSSSKRNQAIAEDLILQMQEVDVLLTKINDTVKMPLIDNIVYQANIITEKLKSDLAAGMEQQVTEFLTSQVNPLLRQMQNRSAEVASLVQNYVNKLPEGLDTFYNKRKDFDQTIEIINTNMARYLDRAQREAQSIYPHYFERYKTDGIEHNMFIGESIAPNQPFEKLYLNNLRLWQLKTMCEIEILHHRERDNLPMPLDVASLIMAYSNHLSIRYRLDEKKFDVDGAYNARYEIIKKRIDKAYIRGTEERITQPGKIVIVYTQPSDLKEYLNYANFLSYQGLLVGEPEIFDIEPLQGVVGLKGVRVTVNFDYQERVSEQKPMTYAAIEG